MSNRRENRMQALMMDLNRREQKRGPMAEQESLGTPTPEGRSTIVTLEDFLELTDPKFYKPPKK